jgi:hypothetical protein
MSNNYAILGICLLATLLIAAIIIQNRLKPRS